ncbi:MAG: hypothetical protein ACN6O6_20060 [Pseudomonas sp.]|uniref:hypothetical protein n=1 Tax=Pseudomonas sp. TaxID=306 RepID=UPI003D141EDA
MDFLKGAKDFARNPLGIIALFISLIYGFASLLLNSAVQNLTNAERWPLILFIVFFPILVLVAFYRLVTKHHGKLYAPGDFKDDKSFLRTLSPEEQEEKLDKEIAESLVVGNKSEQSSEPAAVASDSTAALDLGVAPDLRVDTEVTSPKIKQSSYQSFREEVRAIEYSVVNQIAKSLNVQADLNVGVSGTDARFDAYLQEVSGKFTFLEVKVFRSNNFAIPILDNILYQALLADRFFESNFKLIIAVVHYFDVHELEKLKVRLERKVQQCPADIELKFIHRDQVEKV